MAARETTEFKWVAGVTYFPPQIPRRVWETIGGLRYRYWMVTDFCRFGPFYS